MSDTVFGIDLGTTYSAMCYIDPSGTAAPVANGESQWTTPSVVYFPEPDKIVVGRTAKESAVEHPEQVCSMVKRAMGSDRTYEFFGTTYSPELISSFILRQIAEDAKPVVGEAAVNVVITVPAYFGINQREATKRAGEMAGLNVVSILSEPIAAAFSYGVTDGATEGNILVYDLGGGTFDVTIIEIGPQKIRTIVTGGDDELGGRDWDEVIFDIVAEAYAAEFDGKNVADDPEVEQELWAAAEQAKKDLSTKQEARVRIPGFRTTVTKQQFEEATAPLLERTISLTKETVAKAKEKEGNQGLRIDRVLLVGGSSRMPAVTAAVQEALGAEPQLHDPDLAVARGAALFAAQEMPPPAWADEELDDLASAGGEGSGPRRVLPPPRQVVTVSARAFGVSALDSRDYQEKVFHHVHANDELPAEHTEQYQTMADGQSEVRISVYEQAGPEESQDLEANQLVVEGMLGLPARLPAGTPIVVTMTLGADGLLKVVARYKDRELPLEARVAGRTEAEIEEDQRLAEATTLLTR